MKRLLLISMLLPLVAIAADADYTLILKDHRFQPGEITIRSGKKVKLLVENQDATPEEFDCKSLNREKVVVGHDKATVNIGPLAPGRYPFQGEFHAATAQGAIIVK